uniref:CCHC-type domain-containing protein n=1 Tax=Setaria italica TaxID=4555 RepID=K3ZEK3_SETIT
MGPFVEKILDASILPLNFDIDYIDWSNITQEQLDSMHLNACVTNFLCKILNDAHLIWSLLMELYAKPECDDEKQAEEKSLEKPVWPADQTSSIREASPVCDMDASQDSSQALSLPGSTTSNEVALYMMAKKNKQAKKGKSQKIEVCSSLAKELSSSNSIMPPWYVTSLEKPNEGLIAKLEKLTSEHIALQATHKELECSHEKLVKSYAILDIAHEIILTSVERLKKDLSDLKGKGQVQPSQDNHEVMVKKLEKGSTVTCSAPQQNLKTSKSKIQQKKNFEHIKCFNCSKMGYFASTCPTKLKRKETLSKRQRSLAKKRVCYGSSLHCSKEKKSTSLSKKPTSKQRKEKQEDILSNKDKNLIFYTCRQKGHMNKDSPNGNTLKSNLIHYDFSKLGKDKVGTCAIRVISSPQSSIRAIWVPKHLVANLNGSNKSYDVEFT